MSLQKNVGAWGKDTKYLSQYTNLRSWAGITNTYIPPYQLIPWKCWGNCSDLGDGKAEQHSKPQLREKMSKNSSKGHSLEEKALKWVAILKNKAKEEFYQVSIFSHIE